MKKIIFTIAMLLFVTSLFAGSFDRWGLEAKFGYSTVHADVKNESKAKYREGVKFSGLGAGIGFSFKITPKTSLHLDGQYIFPLYMYETENTDKSLVFSGNNNEYLKKQGNTDIKKYGYKIHLGFGFSLTDYDRVYVEPVINGVFEGGHFESTVSDIKSKMDFWAIGAGLGFNAGYHITPNFVITAQIQPEIMFYSKIKETDKDDLKSTCAVLSTTALLGAKFVF